MHAQLQVARAASSLECYLANYWNGPGLVEIGRFKDRDGLDRIRLCRLGHGVLLEQTSSGDRPAAAPSKSTFARVTACMLALGIASHACAAPDEEQLGKSQGYPVAKFGNNKDWYYDEIVRVGSFTHQAEIPGLFQGKVNTLARAPNPLALQKAINEPAFRWSIDKERDLTVDDFLARQRIMGLLVAKDGVVQVERYQYDRKPADRFTSNSMAKSITSLAIGFALDGSTRSPRSTTLRQRYVPKLVGTIFGETSIRNLLRMASGIRYEQAYGPHGRHEAL